MTTTRRIVPPTEDGARALGDRYWQQVRRASLGLVRIHASHQGDDLELRPLGIPLLRFGKAELVADADCVRCRFPIRGGVLARRTGGALVLSQTAGDVTELRAALTGFVPRLGSRPYDQIQRRIHVAISRRFFRSLLRGAA